MDYFRQVQKGIEYVEDNLDQDIDLSRVAAESDISRWHFQRIFKALTQETLKTYIRSRRMANALNKLLTTKQRVIDIAFAAGYESQESFSRAFKSTFDLTPGKFRKIGDKSLFLQKVKIDADYLEHVGTNLSLTPEIYQQRTLKLVGLKTEFYSVDSEKNNIGDKLPALWESFLSRLSELDSNIGDTTYGVVQQTSIDSERLEYFAAIEVSEVGELPVGMSSVTIPATTYAKFKHTGKVQRIDATVNYIYSNWLMASGRQHSYAQDLEFYGPEYHPTSEQSVMYYAIPICVESARRNPDNK